MENSISQESNSKGSNHSNRETSPSILTYDSPFPIYAMSLTQLPSSNNHHLMAVGSFLEDYHNKIHILSLDLDSSKTLNPNNNSNNNNNSNSIEPSLSFAHPYPPTKLMFHPCHPHLLASSGDFLRLWKIPTDASDSTSIEPHAVFDNSKITEFSAPLTSFDWNDADPSRIGACSIDTTCTIWNVERGVVETQLIAHDKEVYDIAWGKSVVFSTVSADGSVRLFDLREKEHSTILYESPLPDTPLLRLSWNKLDLRYIATILMDSNKVVILDIRSPGMPVAELQRHHASVNAIAWAPHSGRHICSVGDDSQSLIWELPQSLPAADVIDPFMAYSAPSEINQLQWSSLHPDWIAIAFANKMQLLRV